MSTYRYQFKGDVIRKVNEDLDEEAFAGSDLFRDFVYDGEIRQ